MEHSNNPKPSGDSTRKRPRTEYHPWQRRKLRTGQRDEGDDNDDNVYVLSSHFWEDLIAPLPHQSVRRPWPSTSVLLSTPAASEALARIHHAPFLQRFYQTVGARPPTQDSRTVPPEETSAAETIAEEERQLEDLDKPSLSTVTPTQHRRYLKLVQQSERRTPADKGHWKQLRDVVPAEQARYRQMVQKFWLDHTEDRLLLGFRSSNSCRRLQAYCQWACQTNLERTKSLLREQIPTFGKCRQVVSLRTLTGASLPDVMEMDIQRVDYYQPETIPIVSDLPIVGSEIQVPLETNRRIDLALLDDTKALELATQYSATVIVSDETLEMLLKVPGGTTTTTSWLLPVILQNGIIHLETPLPQAFATPRECLTCGLEEGLRQQVNSKAVLKTSRVTTDDASDLKNLRYSYTLWTLPVSSNRRLPLKILIRSPLHYLWGPSGNPLRIRVHVEYFPERGEEIVSQHEQSLWILDQMLNKSTQMCRVDGRTGNVLKWHETSVAHAFASDTSQENPMQGFAQVIQFFHAVSTIDFGQPESSGGSGAGCRDDDGGGGGGGPFRALRLRLVCLPSLAEHAATVPSDHFSVSVHAPAKDDDTPLVDIAPLLQKADGVVMNAKALQACQRPWRWDVADRIPYTFPAKSTNETTTAFRPSKAHR